MNAAIEIAKIKDFNYESSVRLAEDTSDIERVYPPIARQMTPITISQRTINPTNQRHIRAIFSLKIQQSHIIIINLFIF